MGTSYEKDVIAWSKEQAALLRSGRLTDLDIEHIAEEIEDVGKSEQRELASRMAVLLAHLLKWKFQPEHRCSSWTGTIKVQRLRIKGRIADTPSLKPMLSDLKWQKDIWLDAVDKAMTETGLDFNLFPEEWIWNIDQILSADFYPE